MEGTVVSVSELVALVNQTLDYAYPSITVEGEVANFKISKNKWVYFDLKDENSTVRFFGSVYNLKFPIEDGMKVKVVGAPRLHNLYGFSITVQSIELSGEGTIKKALELLKKKLESEGLFADDRKRLLPEYPSRIGLITSSQAAAYSDFNKIINGRWGGLEISLIDVQVQGEAAVDQVVEAVSKFSNMAEPVDVVVIIRGGGSPEDLAAFSAEPVVRAVAGSRVPTVVGIGHESDISLAELAADARASTPTNAAQIVVPDKTEVLARIDYMLESIKRSVVESPTDMINDLEHRLLSSMNLVTSGARANIEGLERTLASLNPKAVLSRGYSIVRDSSSKVIKNAHSLKQGSELMIEFGQGTAEAEVKDVKN